MPSAEEILARQRKLAAARRKRFHEKHPNYGTAYAARREGATRILRDRHRDEYLTLARIAKESGHRFPYKDAVRELRVRYPDEWAALLAAAS